MKYLSRKIISNHLASAILVVSIFLAGCSGGSSGGGTNGIPEQDNRISLTHQSTFELHLGTHRPEILPSPDGGIVLVVVEHAKSGEKEIRHRAYRYGASLNSLISSFDVSWTTAEYGSPADHRAVFTGNELAVVYQSNVLDTNCAETGKGPAEDCALNQSLMLARFSYPLGEELFRGPVAPHVTDFYSDNFPDHSLVYYKGALLSGTGSRGETMKLRHISPDGSILLTEVFSSSASTALATIGNNLFYLPDGRLALTSYDFSRITLSLFSDDSLIPSVAASWPGPDRELTFPTGAASHGQYTFIAYISRASGGSLDLSDNPYYPYLKTINYSLQEISDFPVGGGAAGFSHVHPTVTVIDGILYYAWSSQAPGGGPQVRVETYMIND